MSTRSIPSSLRSWLEKRALLVLYIKVLGCLPSRPWNKVTGNCHKYADSDVCGSGSEVQFITRKRHYLRWTIPSLFGNGVCFSAHGDISKYVICIFYVEVHLSYEQYSTCNFVRLSGELLLFSQAFLEHQLKCTYPSDVQISLSRSFFTIIVVYKEIALDDGSTHSNTLSWGSAGMVSWSPLRLAECKDTSKHLSR